MGCKIIRAVFFLYIFSCMIQAGLADEQDFVQKRSLLQSEKDAEIIPLVSLITVPKQYNGKVVAVEGVLTTEFENQRLYLCKEHAEYLISSMSVDIVSFVSNNLLLEMVSNKLLPRDREHALYLFNKKYVLITGRFVNERLIEVSRVLEIIGRENFRSFDSPQILNYPIRSQTPVVMQ